MRDLPVQELNCQHRADLERQRLAVESKLKPTSEMLADGENRTAEHAKKRPNSWFVRRVSGSNWERPTGRTPKPRT